MINFFIVKTLGFIIYLYMYKYILILPLLLFSTDSITINFCIFVIIYILLAGVRIKSSSITNRLEWQWRQFPFTEKEEICCFKTSITFVDSVADMWAPLLNPKGPLPLLVLPTSTSSNPQLLIPLLNNSNVI